MNSKIFVFWKNTYIKLIYSEKATIFFKISTVDLSYVVPVRSRVDISQNFMALSDYMSFKMCPQKFEKPKEKFSVWDHSYITSALVGGGGGSENANFC